MRIIHNKSNKKVIRSMPVTGWPVEHRVIDGYIYGFSNSVPLFEMKYNTSARFIPLDAIIQGSSSISCKTIHSYGKKRKDILDLVNDHVGNDVANYMMSSRAPYDDTLFLKDGVMYRHKDDVVIPLFGLFIKNNTTNRISIKKDVAINAAIGSSVINVPHDSVLYVHPLCLTKGTKEEYTFGPHVRKLKKTFERLEYSEDLSIFDDMFDHRIKAPKGFGEFEQFNSKVNTHLKQLINEIYE